uniref:Uncharacterized protein n=1 Tax=Anguilla anguilla TaxID=7936 RepID=A0A0E9VK39_ANGAN
MEGFPKPRAQSLDEVACIADTAPTSVNWGNGSHFGKLMFITIL